MSNTINSNDRDRLQLMWDQQQDFMEILHKHRNFPKTPVDVTTKDGQRFLKEIRNLVLEELFEAGLHLKNTKLHRATELPQLDKNKYVEELVDALHLFLELVIASGITLEELVDAYFDKGEKNIKRINNGY